jgi:single-stranded-DNA-specific exonuclease
MNKRWNFRQIDPTATSKLASEMDLPPLVAALLVARGMTEAGQAKLFLESGLESLHSPSLLDGMDKAVIRLQQALQQRERVTVFGDYDVDGVTSTALLLKVFSKIGLNADYYIPDRIVEGYGPNAPAFEKLSKGGTSLVVTVDCGINALAEAEAAKKIGLDLIVTDHHVPGPALPDCLAVLNPKTSPAYPYDMLGGVGVAYKLAEAFLEKIEHPERREILDNVLEFVALGTVADVAPLDGENRVLVREGIRRLRQGRWLGLNCLCEVAGSDTAKIDSFAIGFVLGPRLNAGGRIGDPKLGVELLLSRNKAEAYKLAHQLNEENRERREIEKKMLESARAEAERLMAARRDKVLVVAAEGWHPGVIGLVASRLQDAYSRPTLAIALNEGVGKGSARCQRPFHWVKALEHSAQHLVRFGGHEFAAGITVLPEKVDDLRASLNEFGDEVLKDDDLLPSLRIDQAIHLEEVNEDVMRQISRLSPFGMRNAKPLFAAQGCRLLPGTRTIGNGDHLRLQVAQGVRHMEAVAFKQGPDLPKIDMGRPVDLAFQLSWNDFRGQRTLQLDVKDIRQEKEDKAGR